MTIISVPARGSGRGSGEKLYHHAKLLVEEEGDTVSSFLLNHEYLYESKQTN